MLNFNERSIFELKQEERRILCEIAELNARLSYIQRMRQAMERDGRYYYDCGGTGKPPFTPMYQTC